MYYGLLPGKLICSGIVYRWNPEKNSGWVKINGEKKALFFHLSDRRIIGITPGQEYELLEPQRVIPSRNLGIKIGTKILGVLVSSNRGEKLMDWVLATQATKLLQDRALWVRREEARRRDEQIAQERKEKCRLAEEKNQKMLKVVRSLVTGEITIELPQPVLDKPSSCAFIPSATPSRCSKRKECDRERGIPEDVWRQLQAEKTNTASPSSDSRRRPTTNRQKKRKKRSHQMMAGAGAGAGN